MEIVGVDRDDLYLMQGVRKVIIVDENGDPVTPGPGGSVNTADWDYKLLDLLRIYFGAENGSRTVSVERLRPYFSWLHITHTNFKNYAVVTLGTATRPPEFPVVYLVGTAGELTIDNVGKKMTSTEDIFTADLWQPNVDAPFELSDRNRGKLVDWSTQTGPLTTLTTYKRQIVEEPAPEPVNVPPMFIPNFDPARDGITIMDRGKLYKDPALVGSMTVRLYPNIADGTHAYFVSTNEYNAKFGTAEDATPYKVPVFKCKAANIGRIQSDYHLKGFTEFTNSTTDFAFGAVTSVTKGYDLSLEGIVYSTIPFEDLDGNILRPADPSTSIIKTR